MTNEQHKELLALARTAIGNKLGLCEIHQVDDADFDRKQGLFVTLHKHDKLRGCIGYIKGYKSIKDSIAEMAIAAAFRDPRFIKVSVDEYEELELEISVLSEMCLVEDVSQIEIGRDGLYLEHPRGSGLLLPQVPVEWGWDVPTFLDQICHKAGLWDGAYKDMGAKLYRFEAEIFGEQDSF
ncbi:MAG: AmmeMemoRadiSam system protein A [Candidatus Cloacimonadaceae bacterium]|nr:AmmeMemoRadiSam system protein A [Candidatus Cloacimonadaceae bacterium]